MAGNGGGSLGSNREVPNPANKPCRKIDKSEHLKVSTVIRVLTVLAYIVGVSSAAVLLSAYYVFVWVPHPTEPLQRHGRATDSSVILPRGNSHQPYPKNSYPSSVDSAKHIPHSRASKKAAHYRTTPSPNFLPKPQYLVGQAEQPTPTSSYS